MPGSALHSAPISGIAEKDYRVGTSVASLLKLRDLGLDPPNQVIFQPYAESYIRGDNTRVGDGSIIAYWIFDVGAVYEIYRIVNIYFTSDTQTSVKDIYLRTDDRTAGISPMPTFNNYKATVWRPEFYGPDGTPVVNTPLAIQSARVTFTDLVIQP